MVACGDTYAMEFAVQLPPTQRGLGVSHGRSLVFDSRGSLCRWWRQRGISAAGGTLRAWPADAGLIVLAKLVFSAEQAGKLRHWLLRAATVDGHRRLHLHLGELR